MEVSPDIVSYEGRRWGRANRQSTLFHESDISVSVMTSITNKETNSKNDNIVILWDLLNHALQYPMSSDILRLYWVIRTEVQTTYLIYFIVLKKQLIGRRDRAMRVKWSILFMPHRQVYIYTFISSASLISKKPKFGKYCFQRRHWF